jgi:hypothetical protein
MAAVAQFVFRVLLLLAGLVFAASMAFGFVLVLSLWVVRSTWLRLTGRRPAAFEVRWRRSSAATSPATSPAAPTSAMRSGPADITDVEPHAPRG